MTEREALMRHIQMHDFAMTDAALFLDSHPENAAALRYFRRQQELRKQAVEAYTRKYGPVRHSDYDGGPRWRWVDSPWPWQAEEEA